MKNKKNENKAKEIRKPRFVDQRRGNHQQGLEVGQRYVLIGSPEVMEVASPRDAEVGQ